MALKIADFPSAEIVLKFLSLNCNGLHDNGDIDFLETRPFIAQTFLIEPEIKEKRQRAIKLKNQTKPWFYYSKERGFWLPAA